MSKESALLKEIIRHFAEGGLAIIASNSDVGKTLHNAKELLAQPEKEPNQNIISDIEYLITAFEDGADADDYWLNISDLRDDLVTLKGRVPVRQILEAFPLLDEKGLDQEQHHCEWVLQQDRKRLHAMLFNPLQLLAQPEQEGLTPRQGLEEYKRGYAQAELDLKRETLSEEELKSSTRSMSEASLFAEYGTTDHWEIYDRQQELKLFSNIKPLYTSPQKREPFSLTPREQNELHSVLRQQGNLTQDGCWDAIEVFSQFLKELHVNE